MQKLHIKTGDQVKVISGSDKGKTGKVLQVFPRLGRVVVEGVNAAKRHLKTRSSDQKGQVVEFFMPIHVSNVQSLGSEEKPARRTKKSKA
jgi:large subunit ribosomal protein L24